jgi:hypothetical protein
MDPRESVWSLRFHQLAHYKRAHGHCNVTRKDGPSLELGRWVAVQRVAKRKNKLSAEREATLNAIGFAWGKSRRVILLDWETRFEQLKEYKKANGECDVSRSDSQTIQLGRWVSQQRQAKKIAQLSEEREEKLNSIGFVWSIRYNADWNLRFQQLLEYKQAVGDCHVPQQFRPNPQLGHWVQTQRRANKKKMLTKECLDKLNSIGFNWKFHADWNVRFQQLLEYKEAFGDCHVPRDFRPNPQLGHWVHAQRRANKKEILTKERLEKMNSIGFDWKATCMTKSRPRGVSNTAWDTRFEQLEEYKKANGDFNVSLLSDCRYIELRRWVSVQRYKKNKFLLSQQCEAKLTSIGFVWSLRGCNNADWDVRFRQLLEYKEAVGDCNVPQHFSRNPQLGHWVHLQRLVAKKKSMLTKERWEKLNSIGFDWGEQPSGRIACNQQLEKYKRTGVLEKERVVQLNPNGKRIDKNENCWDTLFRELLSYLQTHGDFNVPPCYPCNPLLSRWVNEQRTDYDLARRGEQTLLTPLREAKLDAIGFTWFVRGAEEDTPPEGVSSAVRPEEVRSESTVRSENVGVASPDRITSG